jgi:hypothetical protein
MIRLLAQWFVHSTIRSFGLSAFSTKYDVDPPGAEMTLFASTFWAEDGQGKKAQEQASTVSNPCTFIL